MLVALRLHAAVTLPPDPNYGFIEFTSPVYDVDELTSNPRIELKRAGPFVRASARVEILVEGGTASFADYR